MTIRFFLRGAPFSFTLSLSLSRERRQVGYDFRAKIVYTAHIIRRVLMTVIDPTTVDDKVGDPNMISIVFLPQPTQY